MVTPPPKFPSCSAFSESSMACLSQRQKVKGLNQQRALVQIGFQI